MWDANIVTTCSVHKQVARCGPTGSSQAPNSSSKVENSGFVAWACPGCRRLGEGVDSLGSLALMAPSSQGLHSNEDTQATNIGNFPLLESKGRTLYTAAVVTQ